jgi:hypothetical protein
MRTKKPKTATAVKRVFPEVAGALREVVRLVKRVQSKRRRRR